MYVDWRVEGMFTYLQRGKPNIPSISLHHGERFMKAKSVRQWCTGMRIKWHRRFEYGNSQCGFMGNYKIAEVKWNISEPISHSPCLDLFLPIFLLLCSCRLSVFCLYVVPVLIYCSDFNWFPCPTGELVQFCARILSFAATGLYNSQISFWLTNLR